MNPLSVTLVWSKVSCLSFFRYLPISQTPAKEKWLKYAVNGLVGHEPLVSMTTKTKAHFELNEN